VTTLYRTRSAAVTARRPNAGPWRVVFADGARVKVPPDEASQPFWRVYCPEDHIMNVRTAAFDLLFAPADKKDLRRLLTQVAWHSPRSWGGRYDWKLGREMWRHGKRAQEIARTLGCSETEERSKSRKDDRRILDDPDACPNCWKVTLTDPCAHCHMLLPVNGAN
jgi:hypothetical protein